MVIKKKHLIRNLDELQKLAKDVSFYLRPNVFLLLQGKLGLGKTTFTKMIAQELGIREIVNSPTFTILKQYEIKNGYWLNHFDFFRLSSRDDINIFEELTRDNLNIIEWPENNPQFWQDKENIHLSLQMKSIKGEKFRMIEIKSGDFS